MNEILNINNVHGYLDKETGMAYLNAEDVARGFGFTEKKGKVEYVKWRRVNAYLHEFGFSPDVAKDDFLPESMVYRLGFKASNETAQKFQALLADEVLPSIRKHGAYLTPEKIEEVLLNPDTIIKLATELKKEREKVKVLTPKAEFYDTVTGADNDWFTMNEAVKILNLGIGRNNTYKVLRWYGILNEKNIPYQRYVDVGYFRLIETTWSHNDEQYTGRSLRVSSKGIDYIRKILQNEGYTYKKFEQCKGE